MRTRQRGHSFYEDEDADGATGGSAPAPASPGRSSPARSSGDASSTDSELSIGGGGGSRDSGEGDSFVSNDSSLSGGSGSRGSDDLEEDDQSFLRGRSRSRSICGGTPDAPEGLGMGTGIVKYDPANPPPSTGSKENKDVPQVPKSGPLAQHEIQVLKKGLEDATLSRTKERLREEEEERQAAATEKRDRDEHKSSTPAYTPGNEPQTAMRRWKILMLGDSGVGKSSLIVRWTLDQFQPSLVGTVGVNFKTKKIALAEEAMQVQVWDTAGQEQFHKITTSYYRGAHGIMLIYDVSDRASFGNIEYWIKNIKAHASGSVHVALVGNKTDLRAAAKAAAAGTAAGGGNYVEYEAGKAVADRFQVPYFEVSAKDNSNVDSAFMTVVRGIVAGEDGEGAGGVGAGGSGAAGAGGAGKAGLSRGAGGAGGQNGKGKGIGSIFGRAEKTAGAEGQAGAGAGKGKKDCRIS